MASEDRFALIQHENGFSILDMLTGNEKWFGTGMATISDAEGKGLPPGREDFVDILGVLLNSSNAETLEEYFS